MVASVSCLDVEQSDGPACQPRRHINIRLLIASTAAPVGTESLAPPLPAVCTVVGARLLRAAPDRIVYAWRPALWHHSLSKVSISSLRGLLLALRRPGANLLYARDDWHGATALLSSIHPRPHSAAHLLEGGTYPQAPNPVRWACQNLLGVLLCSRTWGRAPAR